MAVFHPEEDKVMLSGTEYAALVSKAHGIGRTMYAGLFAAIARIWGRLR